ncbi:hypothetical protein [Bermanella sp. R86510]|uniref:hypothetical protein n=1 Tax=unclassified Bermanella TaxID=2627862 RepID=UPI0037C9FA10
MDDFSQSLAFLNLDYWLLVGALSACFFALDAIVMAFLKGKHRAERSHYLLSILSIGIYIIYYQLDSETFRDLWIQTLLALYLYDVAIILRDRQQIKPSYRQFYSIHHCTSFALFIVWHITFTPFTEAMALCALLWVSSDVWRWAEQFWRLSGKHSSERLKSWVFYVERSHRVFAYLLYIAMLGFSFNHNSEIILLASGILMDVIDTYFQLKVRRYRQAKTTVPIEYSSTQPEKQKRAA